METSSIWFALSLERSNPGKFGIMVKVMWREKWWIVSPFWEERGREIKIGFPSLDANLVNKACHVFHGVGTWVPLLFSSITFQQNTTLCMHKSRVLNILISFSSDCLKIVVSSVVNRMLVDDISYWTTVGSMLFSSFIKHIIQTFFSDTKEKLYISIPNHVS